MMSITRTLQATAKMLPVLALGTLVAGAAFANPPTPPPGLPAPPAPPPTPCDCTSLPSLGRAAQYPGLGIGDILVHLQGSAFADSLTVPGNIGVTGSGGRVYVQGNAGVAGHVAHEPGSLVECEPADSCPSKIALGVFAKDMSGPATDAKAASVAFAAMTATRSPFGSLTGNTTISGNGCINVIEISGSIDIGSNKEITLRGNSEDYFVINITGDFLTSGTADVVLDGMDPSHVIFNLVTPGARVELGGNSGGNFTILNPAGEVYLHGNAGGRGAYYAGLNKLHFQGNTDFYGEPFACGNAQCPDPEASGVNIQTPATPPARSTGNSSFYYAYFDPTTYEGHLEAFRVAPDGTLKDKLNVDAVDSVTHELESGRKAYWDAGIQLRSNASRKLYTTKSGAREIFNTTNVSETDLDLLVGEIPAYPNYPASGVDSLPKLRTAIVDYVYGKDAFDPGNSSNLRSAVLGDIFRSNPLFIGSPTTLLMHEDGYYDFQTDFKPRDRIVYAGANDGIFHAFEAGDYYDETDPSKFNAGSGEERFGYIPGLLLPTLKLTPRTDDLTGERLAPGFVDGNLVAADAWLGDGSGTDITKSKDEWATVMIAAFREGGEGYLAIDVTDPDAASGTAHYPYPKLLWEFTDPSLAESWSRPVITRVKLKGQASTGDKCGKNDGDGDCREQWVAIFGGGYRTDSDPNHDDYLGDHTSLAWNNRSKSIYVVALDTGQVIDSVVFDSTGAAGHAEMKYGIPSAPAVLDVNGDAFADVVYVGDTAGQLWKWDISNVGVDGGDADDLMDNWDSGVYFRSAPVDMGGGEYHYRSMYFPLSAGYINGVLNLAFVTGERQDLLYEGDATKDENNRVYVVRDLHPTGGSAFPSPVVTESNLTDVTNTAFYVDPGNLGYYIVGQDSEKFVTDVTIFANHVIAASYLPDLLVCGPGVGRIYAFRVSNAEGFYDLDASPHQADRHMLIGTGIPSSPRVSIAPDPTDDVVYVNTSDGQVLTLEPPLRDSPEGSVIYWRQVF